MLPSNERVSKKTLKNAPNSKPNGKAGTNKTRRSAGKTNAPTFAKASYINRKNKQKLRK
jgi:hypothetical protein